MAGALTPVNGSGVHGAKALVTQGLGEGRLHAAHLAKDVQRAHENPCSALSTAVALHGRRSQRDCHVKRRETTCADSNQPTAISTDQRRHPCKRRSCRDRSISERCHLRRIAPYPSTDSITMSFTSSREPSPPTASLALQRLYHFEQSEPDRVVLTQPMGPAHGGAIRNFTWREVLNDTRRIARYLQGLNLEPGSRIAILSKNCAYWLMADFAIWMAGYVSVPLYPTLGANTIREILLHSDAKLLFVGKLDGWEGMKEGVPSSLDCVSFPLSPPNPYPGWDAIVRDTPQLLGQPARNADELATIVYTSGTTGSAKGVMHSFGTLAWAAQCGIKRVPLRQDGRVLSYLPLAHVAERALIELGMLATGIHVFFADSLETFVQDLHRTRPTVFFSVPRLWMKFQQNISATIPPRKLSRLLRIPVVRGILRRKILKALGLDACRFAIGGAAPMPPDLLRWFADLGLPIAEVYGMTENGALSHSTSPDRTHPGTVGWPFDGVRSRIDPETNEIQLRSGGVMLGYFNEPALSSEAFTADGWLRTGDKGRLLDDGALQIVGRVKDLFKTSKGKYVAPAPIENQLGMHGDVDACAVVGAGLPQPLGLVRLSDEVHARSRDRGARSALGASLAKHLDSLNALLDPHERLSCLVVVSSPWTVANGLLTPTLKIRRNRIEGIYGDKFESWSRTRDVVFWESA